MTRIDLRNGRIIEDGNAIDLYAEDEERTCQIEILDGDFVQGGTVTVSICGKVFTRKVKYSARKWMDLYITVNGYDLSLSEFMNPDDFRDTDYSYILKK